MGFGQENICQTSVSIGSYTDIQHQQNVKNMLNKMVFLNLLQY
jgi:hypothetical protein